MAMANWLEKLPDFLGAVELGESLVTLLSKGVARQAHEGLRIQSRRQGDKYAHAEDDGFWGAQRSGDRGGCGYGTSTPRVNGDQQIGVGQRQRGKSSEPGNVAMAGFKEGAEEEIAGEKSGGGRKAG